MSTFLKDPGEVLDYLINWNDGWLADDETISTSTWTVPTGITKNSDEDADTTATIWLSGGTHGQEYLCTNQIVTDGGRTAERSILVRVRNR